MIYTDRMGLEKNLIFIIDEFNHQETDYDQMAYLKTIENVKTGNTIIGFAGLGITGLGLIPGAQPLLPVGITMMGTTSVSGFGLGITESLITENPSSAIRQGLILATAPIGGRYIAKGFTGVNVAINKSSRFFNPINGRFIANSTSRISYGLEKAGGVLIGIGLGNLDFNN